MSLLDNMIHKAAISRPTFTRPDDRIEETASYRTYAANVACWVQNATSAEIIEWQKRNQVITDRVFFHVDPGVLVGDRITITSGLSRVDEIFKIKATVERSAGHGILFRAFVEVER